MTAKKAKTVKRKTTARKSSKAGKWKSSKLTASQKHEAHVKHEEHLAHERHLTAIGKAPKAALAKPGDFLPVCAFEAIAQSLRLAGQFVHDDDVAGLWWLAGADPDGASVGDALAAAAWFGLAGCRPVAVKALDQPALPRGQRLHVEDVDLGEVDHGLGEGLFHGLFAARSGQVGERYKVFDEVGAERDAVGEGKGYLDVLGVALRGQLGFELPGEAALAERDGVPLADLGFIKGNMPAHALILGIDAPGPHCVLATPDGWWSWGELHSPWPCRVDQAWAVSWS